MLCVGKFDKVLEPWQYFARQGIDLPRRQALRTTLKTLNGHELLRLIIAIKESKHISSIGELVRGQIHICISSKSLFPVYSPVANYLLQRVRLILHV